MAAADKWVWVRDYTGSKFSMHRLLTYRQGWVTCGSPEMTAQYLPALWAHHVYSWVCILLIMCIASASFFPAMLTDCNMEISR